MQDLIIMFVVVSFAAADKNSTVLMLSSNSAWSPRWDITPIVRQDTQKKSVFTQNERAQNSIKN